LQRNVTRPIKASFGGFVNCDLPPFACLAKRLWFSFDPYPREGGSFLLNAGGGKNPRIPGSKMRKGPCQAPSLERILAKRDF
jgi:hypothetical protein